MFHRGNFFYVSLINKIKIIVLWKNKMKSNKRFVLNQQARRDKFKKK